MRSLAIVELAKNDVPEAVRLLVEILPAVKSVTVVVASVEVPVAWNDPVVSVVNTAFTALKIVAKKLSAERLVVEALTTVNLVIVVVASVLVPRTASVPEAIALPLASTKKLVLPTQLDPFQYNVEFVAEPSLIVPEILVQKVDVPLVASTCPSVPVAPFESRNCPVT